VYESFHGVSFSADARRAAVRLTDRVIADRCLPAKAIELLDFAGARVRRDGREEVDRHDVVAALSSAVDLPPEFLALSSAERLRGMERFLAGRVFGHDAAIAAVVRAIGQNWARYGSRRPLGSFLFAGPDGVGKRTMALATAEFLFGSAQAILEVDLVDYAEQHSLSHLIGSPPGYVGHEEGGLLADTLTRRPFLVVVWRHAEQAHPTVHGLLAQILGEGTATDRRGRRMDFRNTVHVLTTALPGDTGGGRPMGFGTGVTAQPSGAARLEAQDQALLGRCRQVLPADLVGALDRVLAFPPPGDDTVLRIAGRIVRDATARFADEHGVSLVAEPEVIAGMGRRAGARAGAGGVLEAAVSDQILRPAADAVSGGVVCPGQTLRFAPPIVPDGPLEMTIVTA